MGCELKRVPIDFNWPVNKVWSGYLMPKDLHQIPCSHCEQSGYNPATKQIADDFYDHDNFGRTWTYDYGFAPDGKPAERAPWRIIGTTRKWCNSITQDEVQALVDAGRLYDFTHTWEQGKGWQRRADGYVPTADEVNAWNASGMGHDVINRCLLIEARAKRFGVYGLCEHCDGECYTFRDEAHRAAHEAWTRTEPPVGDGYQIWETVSEGSPISPAFVTPEELAQHMAGTKWGADDGTPYSVWLKFIKGPGWAPSLVGTSKGLVNGVAARGVDHSSSGD